MKKQRKRILVLAAAILGSLSLGVESCNEFGFGSPLLYFRAPLFGLLSLPDAVALELRLGRLVDRDSVSVELDQQPLDVAAFQPLPGRALGTTLSDLAEGSHVLVARAVLDLFFFEVPLYAATAFDVADLERPDECEILNNAHCLLPYPSSRFLEEVGSATETGFRTSFPELTIPGLIGPPLD